INAWKYSEFCCRNYILNSLDDNLYDIYPTYKIAKELWESLEKKFIFEDA
ncbi:PREDICTED: TSUD_277700, partial [Prunus dulcis]